MCIRPFKKVVRFYEQGDVSIFTMIKSMAMNAFRYCSEMECKRLRRDHVDYWYHGMGCVEIKYTEDQGSSLDVIRS